MSCSLMEHHPRLCCWTCRPVQHPCTCGSSGLRVCGGTMPERHRPHIHVHLTRQHLFQNHHREHVLTRRDPAIVFTNGRTTVNLTGNAGFDNIWCSIGILITVASSESGLFCCVMQKMWLFTVPLLVRTYMYKWRCWGSVSWLSVREKTIISRPWLNITEKLTPGQNQQLYI